MKVLITGGAGFIGSHLSEYLISRLDAQVNILDDLSSGKMDNIKDFRKKCKVIIGNVCNKKLIQNIGKVDIIFHESSRALIPSFEDPILDSEVNIKGTLNILEFARKYDAILIYASTGSVYGNPIIVPISENHPLNPISPYGISKLSAETYCKFFTQTYGLHIVCLRYFNVYGPRQKISENMGAIPIFVERILNNKPPIIFGDGKQTRDFTYISDVVRANILAMERIQAKGKILNIGSGKETSILDLAFKIMKLCNRQTKPIFSKPKLGDVKRVVADISLAKEVLGYEPLIQLEKGIIDYIQWYGGIKK